MQLINRSLLLWQGEYNSAEEALDATGWLADRPPQAHGETGHAFYTVQVGGIVPEVL